MQSGRAHQTPAAISRLTSRSAGRGNQRPGGRIHHRTCIRCQTGRPTNRAPDTAEWEDGDWIPRSLCLETCIGSQRPSVVSGGVMEIAKPPSLQSGLMESSKSVGACSKTTARSQTNESSTRSLSMSKENVHMIQGSGQLSLSINIYW